MKYLILLLFLPSLAFAEQRFDPDRDLVPGEMQCIEAMKLVEAAIPMLEQHVDLRTIPLGEMSKAKTKKLKEMIDGLMEYAESQGKVQTLWAAAIAPCVIDE